MRLIKFTIFSFLLLYSTIVYSQIPTQGLIAFYPFNGNSLDESGNGHNATVSGASLTYDRLEILTKHITLMKW